MEASAFIRGTVFDPSLDSPQGGIGFGVRFGAYLAPEWLAEIDISTTSASGLSYRPAHIRVNRLEEYKTGGHMVFGVGVAWTHYSGTLGGNDAGLSGAFGLRQQIGGNFFGRLDFALDFIPSPVNGAGNNFHGGFQLGGTYRFGQP